MGDLPRRMPRAARCQFGFFKQHRVLAPAFVTKMVGEADAHNAATDNDDARVAGKFVRQWIFLQ